MAFLVPSNDVFRPFSSNRLLRSIFDDHDDLFGDTFFHPLWDFDPFLNERRILLRPPTQRRKTHWSTAINLSGFKPEEVAVKTEDGKVRIHARQEQGEDVSEVKRTVPLPDQVDPTKVETHLSKEGALVIRGALKKQPEPDRQVSVSDQWPDLRRLLREPSIQTMEQQIVKTDDGELKFQAEVPVREFHPEEIKVQQSGDRVLVHAEHHEERDGQVMHRRLERQFTLPRGAGPLSSKLTENGCLCLEANVAPPAIEETKIVPIETDK